MAIIQHGAIRIDVQANTQGVKTMRTDLASLTRLVNQSATQHEKFEKVLEKIAAVQKEGLRDSQFTSQAVVAAANNFIQAEKAAGRYGEALEYISQRIPELSGEMQRLRQAMIQEADVERARKAALEEQELREKLYKERVERDRKAAAEAKRLAREVAREEAKIQRQKNAEIKALQQQAADVEEYFNKQGSISRKKYLNEQKQDAIAFWKFISEGAKKQENERLAEQKKRQDALNAQYREEKRLKEEAIRDLYDRVDKEEKARKAKEASDEKARQETKRRVEAMRQEIEMQVLQTQLERKRAAEVAKSLALKKQEAANAKMAEKAAMQEALAKENAQRRVNRVIQEGMSPVERLTQKLERFRIELDKGRISEEQFIAVQKRLNAEIAKQNMITPVKGPNRLAEFGTGALSGLSPTGALTAGAAGFMIGSQIVDFAKDSVQAYMDMRSAIIKLEVTLGSADKANVMFNQLRSLAAQMSLTQEAVLSGAVTMAQFGVSAEQLEPAMRRLSIISAGNSQRLQSLAIAYGQVAAAGRLTGQETLQFVNAGFNPLAEIARTTGKSMASLRKEMEEGKITVQMVADAFKSATEQGGRFFGMAEKLSGELAGKVNKLSSEVTKLKEELAAAAMDAAQVPETADVATENISQLRKGINVLRTDIRAFMQGGPSLIGGVFSQGMPDENTMKEIQKNLTTGKTLAERELLRAQERIKKVDEAHAFFAAQAESLPLLADQAMKNAKEGAKSLFDQAKDFGDRAMKSMAKSLDQELIKRAESIRNSIMTPEQRQMESIRELAELVRYNYITMEEAGRFLAQGEQAKSQSISTDLPKAVSMGTREAYELINRTQSTMQSKQLEEQRKQRMAQEAANKLLEQLNKKQGMGILN